MMPDAGNGGGAGGGAGRGLLALAVGLLAVAGIGGTILVAGLSPGDGSSRATDGPAARLPAPTTTWWSGPSPTAGSSVDLPWWPSEEPSLVPTAGPTPRLVALPKLSPKVGGATMKYYAVAGDTASELIDEMDAHGPPDSDPDTETLARASIRWTYTYRYRVSSSGACTVISATVSPRYAVTLPRWTGPSRVRAELVAWWRLVVEALRTHEAKHIRIYGRWMARMREQLVGARCSAVASIERRITRGMRAENDALDKREGIIDMPPYGGDWGWGGCRPRVTVARGRMRGGG